MIDVDEQGGDEARGGEAGKGRRKDEVFGV